MSWLLIAIGSALGGLARHALGLAITQRMGSGFPWGTLTVNVVGSFAIGFVAALAAATERAGSAQFIRDFAMIGFLGGFTTFSAFSLQTLQLLREDKLSMAFANVGASVIVCLIGVWLGYAAATTRMAS